MTNTTLLDVIGKLDLVQQSIWSMEEKLIESAATRSKLNANFDQLKSSLELVSEKIDNLDAEMRSLRNNAKS
jgi:uncharacterized coiled-coil DUF342 family protein